MIPEAVLIELLERMGDEQDADVLVTDHELKQWPTEAVIALKKQSLIVKARPAASAICPGCERDCMMPVNTVPSKTGDPALFIVCDKRSDINRVPVFAAQLTQWQCSTDTVCSFIGDCLGLRTNEKRVISADLREIGIASGDKRRQMLCLQTGGELSLVIANSTVPLIEFIDYKNEAYSLNESMIRQLVDATTTADDRYTPTKAKRELRHLETQSRYKSWQKEYRKLKKKHPNMTDVWCSEQIAKLDIAQGRASETISRNMKK